MTKQKAKPVIDPSLLRPVMYWAGLSLHACQQLEYGVKLLLWLMAKVGYAGALPVPAATAIIEGEGKNTLGQLLNVLKTNCTITDKCSATLRDALDARNHIIHRVLIGNAERIAAPRTRPEVLTELKRLRRMVLAGDDLIRTWVDAHYKLAGLDPDELHRELCEEIRNANILRDKPRDGSNS